MTSTTILTAVGARHYLLILVLVLSVKPGNAHEDPADILNEADKYEGKIIHAIEFDPADQPLTKEDLKRRLVLRPGSVFSQHALQQSIQRLFATGRYSDVAVDGTAAGAEVDLRFLTKRAYFVGRVTITGVKQPPNSGQLSSAIKLGLGAPYTEAQKNQALESLQQLLRRNGFFHPSIKAGVVYHPNTERADLIFAVNSGKRAHFADPVITGDARHPKDKILRATHWKRLYGLLGWQDVTEARVRQGLENVRRLYEAHDLLESKVILSRFDYEEADNAVRPSIHVDPGPLILLRIEGANISRARLRELVPVFQEKSLDPDLLLEGQRNVAEYLQADGYSDAAVSYTVDNREAAREQIITYHVNHGPRHKFVHLEISGNHYFSRELIRERLYLEPAGFPRFPYGRFSAAYLKQDVQAVESLYISNGFRDVKVTTRVVDNFEGAQNHLAVFISIEEGSQWHVSSLSIEGASNDDIAALRSRLAAVSGQPFSPAAVADDRDSFLNYYYGRGYLNATFDFYQAPAAQDHKMQLRYVVNPGVRQYVRGVLISGLETTRRKLVDERIGLQAGQALSLTEETDSQRRLYDLGIFARVNTAVQNPDGDELQKYVLYDIDEARHYSLNVAVGAQIARIGGGVTSLENPAGATGFAPRLAVGISRINLFGLAQTLGLQTSVSTLEQKAALTYFIPQFVSSTNLSLTSTALVENSNDIRTYTAHRREAAIQLGQRLSRVYTAQYRLVFRNVTITNLKIDPLLVPLLSQPERLGLAQVSLIQDKRDDPADAHQGIYSTADFSYGPGFLGSQTSFARALFRNSTYHPIHRDLVFARSTQFGLISRLGGAHTIPLAERLYSGGSTSLRSFPDFQAGPRDLQTGFPLGGNALLVNTLELRFPLYGDNVGGVLFEDAGNVYSTLGDLSFRFRQRNLQHFNYMVQSLGFGIRYRTPIGPLRLDFSFSPDAPRFFGLKGTLEDLINGTAVSTVQKINAFQFHVSLGQAF